MSTFEEFSGDRTTPPTPFRGTLIYDRGPPLRPGADVSSVVTTVAMDVDQSRSAQPCAGRYTLSYDARFPTGGDPCQSTPESCSWRSDSSPLTAATYLRTTLTYCQAGLSQRTTCTYLPDVAPQRCSDAELADAYNLFLQLRHAVAVSEQRSTEFQARWRNALLGHKVMDVAFRHAWWQIVDSSHPPRDCRNDLFQEALVILHVRLASPALRFVEQGPVRFFGWLLAVVEGACHDALGAPRLARWKQIDFVPSSSLERIAVSPSVDEPDRLDLSARLTALIDALPDAATREVLRDSRAARTIVQSAARLGMSASRVKRLRVKGVRQLRRLWRKGNEGR